LPTASFDAREPVEATSWFRPAFSKCIKKADVKLGPHAHHKLRLNDKGGKNKVKVMSRVLVWRCYFQGISLADSCQQTFLILEKIICTCKINEVTATHPIPVYIFMRKIAARSISYTTELTLLNQ
jgi:hypothetical protein